MDGKKGPPPPPSPQQEQEGLKKMKKKAPRPSSRETEDAGIQLMKAQSEPARKSKAPLQKKVKGKGKFVAPNMLQQMSKAQENLLQSKDDYENAQASTLNEEEVSENQGLLSDIKSFNKKALKPAFFEKKKSKRPDDYSFEDDEYEIPKAKPMTFDYRKLYYDHLAEGAEAVPIHRLKFMILQINARSDTTLNFTGVAVLTDITFALLADLQSKEQARLKAVTSVILDGCHQITDAGIAWLGKAFPNLTWLSCSGCSLVTDAGILSLSDLCPQLTSMDISGTQVTLLPKRWASADGLRMTCTPILYPKAPADMDKASKGKSPVLKLEENGLLGICIAHPQGLGDVNLLGALKGEKPSSSGSATHPAVQYSANVPISREITASIVEAPQSVAPLFISGRSVVVIPSTLKDKGKIADEATSIVSMVVQIRAKHPNVPIILVGCSTNEQGIVPTAVVAEQVTTMVKKHASVLREKYPVLSTPKKEGVIENMDVSKQLELSRAICLMERLENLKLFDLEINLDTDVKPLSAQIAKAALGSPGFTDLAYDKDIYDWALSFPAKCPQGLKSGVTSLDAAAQTISSNSRFKERLRPFGAVHFLRDIFIKICSVWLEADPTIGLRAFKGLLLLLFFLAYFWCCCFWTCLLLFLTDGVFSVGQFCSWTDHEKGTLVANNEWMCSVLSTLMTDASRGGDGGGQQQTANDGQSHVIDDATPVWSMDRLMQETKAKIKWEQVEDVIRNHSNIFYSTDKVVTPWTSLNLDSTMTLDHFTNFNKDGADGFPNVHLMMSFALDINLTPNLLHTILGLVLKLHAPVHVWQTGVVINEGAIAVMVAATGYAKLFNLCAYMPYLDKQANASHSTLIWSTLNKYKVVIDYVLAVAGLQAETIMRASNPLLPAPERVDGILRNHKLKDVSVGACSDCGTSVAEAAMLGSFSRLVAPTFCNNTSARVTQGSVEGSVIQFSGKGQASFKTYLNAIGNNECSVTLMQGVIRSLKVVFWCGNPSFEVTVDLKEKVVIFGGKSHSIADKLGEGTLQGSVLKAKMRGPGPIYMDVFMGPRLLVSSQVPNGRYYIRVDASNVNDGEGVVASVTMSNIDFSSVPSELKPGMRLEALDRKTPSLICVATIEEIKDDQVKIHFDGWGATYDYWTEFDVNDLFPIGYMHHMRETNGHKRRLNKVLQAPSGKGNETFKWPEYLEKVGAEPVPYDLFSEQQTQGTPPTETEKAQEHLGVFYNSGGVACSICRPNIVRTSRYKMDVKQFVHQISEKDIIKEEGSNWYTFLPNNLSLATLRYPVLKDAFDIKKMNIHFLCDWQGLEFHFSNHPGIPVTKTPFESTEKWPQLHLAGCTALLLQKDNLPANPSIIIAGAETLPSEKMPQLELGLRRLLQMYITYALIMFGSDAQKLKVKIPGSTSILQDWFDNSKEGDEGDFQFFKAAEERMKWAMENDKQFVQNFQYKAGSDGVLCKAHKLADSPQSDIQEINIEQFNGLTARIYHLNLSRNPIQKLQDDLFVHFNNLTRLHLNSCNITGLPSFSKNVSLEDIDVRNNKLTSLPDDIEQLKGLKILQISNNPLMILPPKISNLTTLIHLAADNIGTVDMNIVCGLELLEFLSVSFNLIQELPEKLGQLPLQTLYMAGLPLMPTSSSFAASSINSFLQTITVYQRLQDKEILEMIEKADNNGDSNSSKISEFNKLLKAVYPQFTKNKGYKDDDFPAVLLALGNLRKLHLSNHTFTAVPDAVKQLEKLTSLNVESNPRLESVSAELANLPLKELQLRDCPMLKTPPKEVVRRGFAAVFGYLKRLLQGSVLCKRTKLMMVGLGGAGKTSLVRALTNKSFRYNETLEEEITDGIDITEWMVQTSKLPAVNDESSDKPVRFSVWDFAGQTVYYNTHQFFLSNRAVYLLLWNIRLGFEHAGLDFWLSSVTCHAPKAPIVVVGTHCDKVERGKLPTEELKRKFPKIVGFHFVSSYTGEGIDNLRLEVIRSALKQEYMGEKIPEAWLSLETGLDKVRGNKSLVKWEEIEDVANTAGIFDKVELTQSVQFLHDLGSVQFFNTHFLKSHVVIVPQWIVDVMACIVTVHDGPTKDGKLKHKDMALVWADYPKELHPWLLRLTEEFDLTFPISNEEANIVPCLLPNSEPKYEFAPTNKDKREREAQMVYRFEYLPAGLFNRAQVRLHQFSDTSLMWKKGFMLKKNDHRALLLQTSNTGVDVTARGFKPENILFLIHEVIESLVADSYAGVSYDFSLPCLDCASNLTLEPSMFHASKVKRAVEMKAPFLQCDKHFHVISIPEIRAAMPPDRQSDFDEHLGRSVRELQELEEGVAIKCLFIYSKKNVPDLAQEGRAVNPIDVLADLRKEGFNVSYCDDPETANMESMTLAIKSAQIVIICISDDFVKSEQCRDLIIYTKKTLNKLITLLVLGPTTDWQKTDINLVLADELFVRMADMKSYPIKLKELKEAVKTKVSKKTVTYPDCFISYCWANSKSAVELGMPEREGALGWADPRKVKDFLQEKGVNCWLDVNQMGQEGFFEDIADGLRKAKVMVACVSDEYANSKNCKMEFRFALSTLKIPTVLAVVGTGYQWERSEVGLLTVGHSSSCPKINLQYPNEGGMLDLLKAVQAFIPADSKAKGISEKDVKSQQDVAFQEVLELAQRKLLRQVMMYESMLDTEDYPRLIMLDLKSTEAKRPKSSRTPRNKDSEDKSEDHESMEDETEKSDTYCYRLFCEHELGWHESPETLTFPAMESAALSDFLKSVSAYTVRLMAILKHTKSKLHVLNTPAGEQLQRKMEEWCNRTNSDFKGEYQIILNSVLGEDKNLTYGGLKRCNMPNKKILWLCRQHEKHSLTQTEDTFKGKIETNAKDPKDVAAPTGDNDGESPGVETDSFVESASFVSDLSYQDTPNAEIPEASVAKRLSSITVAQPARGPALPPSRPKMNRHKSGKKTTSQACRLM